MACCPTCGGPAPDSRLLVSLENNRVTFGGKTVQLAPLEAEIAEVLRGAYPRSMPTGKLISRVYGAKEVNWAENCIIVTICRMRRKLAPLGVGIRNFNRTGYRFEFADAQPVLHEVA